VTSWQSKQSDKHDPGRARAIFSIPADAMIILPVRQTVLFPGIVPRWRSGGSRLSPRRRKRCAANA
jgi:hypothetical protein